MGSEQRPDPSGCIWAPVEVQERRQVDHLERSLAMLKDRLEREARLQQLSAVGFHKGFLEGAEL